MNQIPCGAEPEYYGDRPALCGFMDNRRDINAGRLINAIIQMQSKLDSDRAQSRDELWGSQGGGSEESETLNESLRSPTKTSPGRGNLMFPGC